MKETKSKFIKVACSACGIEQVMFSHPSTKVRCLTCNAVLAKPTGGKTPILKKDLDKAMVTAIEDGGKLVEE